MTCFKVVLIYFTLWNVSIANELETNYVLPQNSAEQEVQLGNIYKVKVVTQNEGQLEKYKNTFINSSMYVLEVNSSDKLTVFIGPPNDKIKEKLPMKNFKMIESGKQPPQSFAILDIPFIEETEEAKWGDYVLWSILAVVALIITYFLGLFGYKKYKARSRKKEKSKKLMSLIKRVEKREEFERIYKYKKEFTKFTSVNSDLLDEYIKVLNEIQYKKEWTDEDYQNIQSCMKKIQRSEMS